jgi:nucleotide-binding universal stress UspA family protein
MKKLNINNILVPIDFSEMSIQSIATAKSLAQRFQSKVHLLNIQEPYPPMFYGAGAPVAIAPFETGEELRQSAVERLTTLAKESGITGRCEAVTGAPVFNEVCAVAKEIPADLIVMSTHGRTGLKHVFLGSTAERLVQHSPCPVFVSREGGSRSRGKSSLPMNTILVPVDFSGCSLAGLEYAIAFAERVAARIIVFHALDLGYAHTADGYAIYDVSFLQDAAREGAEAQMKKFVRAARFGSVKFETAIEIGPPVWEICEFAEKRDVDLIISATHGWTGFKHILIGSTAEQVVRHAPCSVLIAPSHSRIRTTNVTQPRVSKRTRKTASKDRKTRRVESRPQRFARRYRLPVATAFPERRKTNKFRETHPHRS